MTTVRADSPATSQGVITIGNALLAVI
jgi:hypothetical protein